MPQSECGFPDQPDSLLRFGPTLQMHIGFDPEYRHDGDFSIPSANYGASVDRGASESCTDSSIAVGAGLPIIDRRQVSGAHGSAEVNVHLAQISIPELQVVLSGRFAGVHLFAGGQPHGALISRTLVRHVTMVYNGVTGSVSIVLSRPPSLEVP